MPMVGYRPVGIHAGILTARAAGRAHVVFDTGVARLWVAEPEVVVVRFLVHRAER